MDSIARDDVVSIVVHSGSKGAVSLKDLTQEEMTRVLSQNRNLGTSIDLVGVYLKNYEIDKADCLCKRIAPLCRERGGVWLFKLLNFHTTVRMKQSRYKEALSMYQEYETLIGFLPEEAWELYDTVYRNYGWIYTSLHDYEKALEYFEKAVQVKRANGVNTHWFDQWDLGKTHARLSLQRGRPQNLELALKLIKESLQAHERVEPKDVIMRCKMLNSAGECAAVRGDFCKDQQVAQHWYDESIALHKKAYDMYMKVLGPSKPLTGWAMEDLAGAYQRRGRLNDAKPLLHAALKVECSKDIIKLSSMARLLDSILEVHRTTSDSEGLADCQDAINIGLSNLQRRRVDQTEAASYAALLVKIADVLLAHDHAANRSGATSLLQEAFSYLRNPVVGTSATPCEPKTRETEQHEREEQFSVPSAGQQELKVCASDVLEALERRAALLGVPLAEVSSPEATETSAVAREAAQGSGLAVETPAAARDTVQCPSPTRQWTKLPDNFEVVDDFPAVD